MVKTASELYAISQGGKCTGNEECHYCGSPCERRWLHNEPPPVPFTKKKNTARRPSSLYICSGCWFYKMERITVRFLDNTFKDRQSPQNHSWLITKHEARAIDVPCHDLVYPTLLSPPLTFSLSLRSDFTIPNLLQLQTVNHLDKIQADTPLNFTIDHTPHTYTVYELEEGLKHGADGKMPGVQALIRYLGAYQKQQDKRGKGRPKVDERRSEDKIDPDKVLKRLVAKKE
jgi:hypothetical protein